MDNNSYYALLGVSSDASLAEIKSGYIKQSRIYHPDRMEGESPLYHLIQEAYTVLRDEKSRAAYDRSRGTSSYSSAQPPEPEESSSPPLASDSSEEINWNDITWLHEDYSGRKEQIITRRSSWNKAVYSLVAVLFGLALLSTLTLLVASVAPWLAFAPTVALLLIPGYLAYSFAGKDVISLAVAPLVAAAAALYAMITLFPGDVRFAVVAGAILALGGLQFWSGNLWRQDAALKRRQGVRKLVTAKDLREYVSWGTPGALRSPLRVQSIAEDETAAKMTNVLLNELLIIPGTRIIHGINLPGGELIAADHAVINGEKIALIESRLWKGDTYSFDGQGNVTLSNGRYHPSLTTNFVKNVEAMARDFAADATVFGWFFLHSADGTLMRVTQSNEHGQVRLLPLQQALEEVGTWLAKDSEGTIHAPVINHALRRHVS